MNYMDFFVIKKTGKRCILRRIRILAVFRESDPFFLGVRIRIQVNPTRIRTPDIILAPYIIFDQLVTKTYILGLFLSFFNIFKNPDHDYEFQETI